MHGGERSERNNRAALALPPEPQLALRHPRLPHPLRLLEGPERRRHLDLRSVQELVDGETLDARVVLVAVT